MYIKIHVGLFVYLFIVWSNYSLLLDRLARGFLQNNPHHAEKVYTEAPKKRSFNY